MGYAHGTCWTDELIKEKVLDVIKAYELDRMPSKRECDEYYHNYALSNAISKKKGWYKLAKELGLPIKESETYFGKKQEEIARETLISHGYEVRKMPQNFPYDLLINDCVKVDVKASKLYIGKHGNFYTFNIEKPYCTCDIYLLYLIDGNNFERDILIIPSKFVPTSTQISVGEKKSKYYRFSNQWEYIKEYVEFMGSVS